MTCLQCQRSAPPDAKFCTECGARLIVRCPACAVDNAPGSKFCKECGQALARPATPPAVALSAAAASPPPQSYIPAHLAQRILHDRSALPPRRAVLAPVYEWFTDGFETADLGAAKTLLAKLG